MWRHSITRTPRTDPKPAHSKPADPRSVKAPTLVQVARLAGVGVGTASRVLNNEGYVSERTAARVRAVIEQIGYKPNEVARNLKVRRSGAIGIVVPNITDPFIAACVQDAQSVIRNSGNICILTFSGGSQESEAREIDYLIRRQIDGMLIIPASGGSSPHLTPAILNGKPLVSFDQPIAVHSAAGGDVPAEFYDSVLVHNREGAIAGTEHLVGHGHKRIVALGVHKNSFTIEKRIEGYREVMKRARLTPEVCVVEPHPELIAAQVDLWLDSRKPPTAIFSLNCVATTCLLSVLADRGVSIPGQMALLGFDDLPLGALLASPLTVVSQPAAQLGAKAAMLLLERMANPSAPTRHITLDTELIIRRSCGCA